MSHALTAREIAVLDFEREWTRHVGAKEEAIREVFGLSAARYYQVLNTVIDSPHAVRHNPMLVKRLQRARDARVQTRATRTLSSSRQVDSAHRPLPDETTD
ncbi:DUF3263 domain-containing protein [Conyzicola sp.]|uniref:DUF3263 domain-containing protein n=1 Tax=Conyzicola sp. TaxID=1969404 RepID=UPI003988E8C0